MTIFARSYIVCQTVAPSTLTINTPYLSVRNTGTTVVYLKHFQPSLVFSGTNAQTASALALLKQSATPTGGTVITPTKLNSAQLDPSVDCRFSLTGLGGFTPNATDRFHLFGITSQSSAPFSPEALRFDDDNLLQFNPGECLIVVAHTAIVSGVAMFLPFLFYQD